MNCIALLSAMSSYLTRDGERERERARERERGGDSETRRVPVLPNDRENGISEGCLRRLWINAAFGESRRRLVSGRLRRRFSDSLSLLALLPYGDARSSTISEGSLRLSGP